MKNTPSQLNTDLAALLGFAAGNRTAAANAIKQALQGLGIDKLTKSLTADDKAAIIQWHKARLTDKNQLDIETIAPPVVINEPIETAPVINEPIETTTIPTSPTDLTPVEIDITRLKLKVETMPGVVDTIADDPAITERYDFNAMVQLSLYVGARKQCHIAIDGFYLNALMTMAGIDKKGVKEWVQNAVDSWGAFDPKLNITRQVRSLIVRQLESELIKARG